MLRALGLAVADLADRRILAIMAQALAVTLLIFVLLGGLLFWLFAGADPCSSVGMDSCPLDIGTGGLGAVLLTLLALWFSFRPWRLRSSTTFTDRVAHVVEERHYPDAAREARPIGILAGSPWAFARAAACICSTCSPCPSTCFCWSPASAPSSCS